MLTERQVQIWSQRNRPGTLNNIKCIIMLMTKIMIIMYAVKGKGIPQQTEVAPGVPGRLRPRIFSTFSTTRVVGRQPNAPAAFTPGEIPGTHF